MVAASVRSLSEEDAVLGHSISAIDTRQLSICHQQVTHCKWDNFTEAREFPDRGPCRTANQGQRMCVKAPRQRVR